MLPGAVVIAGVHRGGTSLVARALGLLGLELGPPTDLKPGAPDNPEGFWEHKAFVAVNDRALEVLGGAWDCPPVAVPSVADERLTVVRSEAESAIARMRAHAAGRAWGWKDPRNSVMLPFWLELLPDLVVVECVRNPLEVAVSLQTRNGHSYAFGLRLWLEHHHRLAAAIPEDRRVVVHYDSLLTDHAAAQLHRVAAFIGLDVDDLAVAAAAAAGDTQVRHSRLRRDDLQTAGASADLIDTYDRLCARAGWTDDDGGLVAAVPLPTGLVASPSDATIVDAAALDHLDLARKYHRRGGRIAVLEQRLAEAEADAARLRALLVAGESGVVAVDATHMSPTELEARRAGGLERAVVGSDAGPGLLAHLQRYAVIFREGGVAVHDLHAPIVANPPRGTDVAELFAEFERRFHRPPSVLDWHSGLGLEGRFPDRPIMLPAVGLQALPHLDKTVDLVAIGSLDSWMVDDAHRVASAGVLLAMPDGDLPYPAATVEWLASAVVPPAKTVALVLAESSDAHRRFVLEGVADDLNVEVVEDATATTADVVVSIDGHIAPIGRWLEPLLDLLHRRPDADGVVGRVVRDHEELDDPGANYVRLAALPTEAPIARRRDPDGAGIVLMQPECIATMVLR